MAVGVQMDVGTIMYASTTERSESELGQVKSKIDNNETSMGTTVEIGASVQETKQHKRVCLGVLLAIISSVSYTISAALVDWISSIDDFEASAFRFLGSFVPSICALLYWRDNIFPVGKCCVLLSIGVCSFFGVIFAFYAFKNMPFGDATAIIFSSPIFTFAIGCFCMGDKFVKLNVISVAFSIIGLLLVTQPPILFHQSSLVQDSPNYYIAALSALCSAIIMSTIFILFSQIKEQPLPVKQFHFSALPLATCLILCWVGDTWSFPEENLKRFALLGISVTSFLIILMISKALDYISPGHLSIARSADIIISYSVQNIVFMQKTSPVQIIGCIIIIISIILPSLDNKELKSNTVTGNGVTQTAPQ